MNNIKLTAVARNTDESIVFSPQDIMTLYVGGEFNTFVNVDTVEAVNVETPITGKHLASIGFIYHSNGDYKYKDNLLLFVRLTKHKLNENEWWLTLRSQDNFLVDSMEKLQTVLDALFWHEKEK